MTWALRAAAWLAALETTAIIALLIAHGGRAVPLAVGMLVVKYPFCVLAARRSAGGWFGLLLWELAGMLAAVTAPRTPFVARLAELAVALTVAALLLAAAPSFPSVKLPSNEQ